MPSRHAKQRFISVKQETYTKGVEKMDWGKILWGLLLLLGGITSIVVGIKIAREGMRILEIDKLCLTS